MKNYLKNMLLIGTLFLVGCSSLIQKKENASIIIKNGTVLTMDKNNKVINNGVVIIKDNKIISVGNKELLKVYSAKKNNRC